MGMYDQVQCDAVRCPLCGAVIDWQTKDGPCLLEDLTVLELLEEHSSYPEFYGDCKDCRVWVEVKVKRFEARTSAQWSQFRREREILAAKQAGVDDD